MLDLRPSELWIDGQGQRLRCEAFGHREVAEAVAEPGIGRLEMDRDGIVEAGEDAVAGQRLANAVARAMRDADLAAKLRASRDAQALYAVLALPPATAA